MLETRVSLLERRHAALFLRQEVLDSGRVADTARLARGEIGHVHTDLSVHLYFSPADARALIEKGWAERHRLAVPRDAWWKNKPIIADTYLLVYGPRDEEEFRCFSAITLAAIRFMAGSDELKMVS
jgi:hypothetical protein